MNLHRPAIALLTAALGLFTCAAAHAFGESEAKAMCQQYVRGRLQKGDSVEWVGAARWQGMDTTREQRWAVFLDFRTLSGGAAPRMKKAACQGRFDPVSSSWKIVDYSER